MRRQIIAAGYSGERLPEFSSSTTHASLYDNPAAPGIISAVTPSEQRSASRFSYQLLKSSNWAGFMTQASWLKGVAEMEEDVAEFVREVGAGEAGGFVF